MIQKAIDVSQRAHGAWERKPLEERADIFLKAADLISGKYRMDLMAATMLGQVGNKQVEMLCQIAMHIASLDIKMSSQRFIYNIHKLQ
jgi:1-pyrroline-5-carboxylate dehydrogenase